MDHTTALVSLLDTAESIARSSSHTELDPGHLLLAVVERGYPLGPDLLKRLHLDVDALRADLDRRLRGDQPHSSAELHDNDAMSHVRASAAAAGHDGPVTPEAMVIGAWNAPGATSRFTHRGRWLATAALRSGLGVASPFDRLRMFVHHRQLVLSAQGRRLRETSLGRQVARVHRIVGAIRAWLAKVSGVYVNGAALLLFAPGIAMREGSRAIVAHALGSRRRGPELLRSLGADYYLDPVPGPARTGTILLGPHIATFAVGVVLLLQPLIDVRTLGTNPLPAFTRRGGEIVSVEETALVADFLFGSPATVWFSLACFFVAIPPYSTVRQARAEFSACRLYGRTVSALLLPVAILTACLTPIEWMLSRLGFNAILGVGLLGAVLGLLLTTTLVDSILL